MVLGTKEVNVKKKIIILLLPLLLTGCTINYDLTINKNSISETITGSVEKSEYEIKDTDTSLNNFYILINEDVNPVISSDDLYKKNIIDTDTGIDYKYTYNYKKNYDKSRIINSCFENHLVSETDDYYKIELTGKFYCLYSDKIDINVTSNYEVIENNASVVNGNKYKWIINSSDNVNILLTVSKKVEYTEPVKAKTFSTFQLIGLIIFVILTVITYFLYKKKNSGKI